MSRVSLSRSRTASRPLTPWGGSQIGLYMFPFQMLAVHTLQPRAFPKQQATSLATTVRTPVTPEPLEMRSICHVPYLGPPMVSQVLWADLKTRNLMPQYRSISGMNGRPSTQPRPSSVARISSALFTSTQSPARKPARPKKSRFSHGQPPPRESGLEPLRWMGQYGSPLVADGASRRRALPASP